MPSLGIVVPAFDPNAEVLVRYLAALRETLHPDRLHVELDEGRRETAARLHAVGVTVNNVSRRRGKGAAITAGFEALDTDVLAFADADGSTGADSLADVVAAVTAGGADLAVGSRRHPDAEVTSHQTFARRFLGDAFAWLAGRLLAVDLYDYQCGAKALTAAAWERVRDYLHEPGFAWDVELVAMAGALDLRVEEVPLVWEDKPGSTVSVVYTPFELLETLLAARHRAKRLEDSRLHEAIAARREGSAALVERNHE